MKKILLHNSLILFCFGSLLAQTPMFFNTNVGTGGNAFPLGNTATSRKVQWCIPAGSLGTVTPGNNITTIYFQSGSNATNTYPIINLKLKTGSSTGLTGTTAGPIEAGMTTVYTATARVIASTAGSWIAFPLTTPWLYNPALPLYVELEHNATSLISQTLYQAVNISGQAGNGRQWADYNVGTLTGTGLNQINFGIDVIPATPCTAAPPANSVAPANFTTCPGINNPTIGLASTYSLGGITYQWFASTTSSVGPFTAIPGATLSTVPAPTLATTTWFQVVATCTNPGGGNTNALPNQFFVAGTVTNTIPYNESFENIQIFDRLPNCSWWANGLGSSVRSYTNSSTSNRLPRTGTAFAAFQAPTTSTNNTIYSNGVWLEPGITYSSSIWYQTDLTGASNWSNLSLSIGTAQSSSSQTLITNTNGPAIGIVYRPLSGTFTVGSAGLYYTEIKVNGNSGGAPFLMLDDLSIIAPCSLNSPNLTASANSTNICQGTAVFLNASGANTYSWSTGATTFSTSTMPITNTQFMVLGTNTLSGCTSTAYVNINVNPSPIVFAMPTSPFVCLGSVATLMASGANAYQWSNATSGPVTYVTPTVNTTYTVIGTNANNCSGSAVVSIIVNSLPNVNPAISTNLICVGEKVDLIASGANSYQWISNANSQLYVGSPVSVILTNPGVFNFTVTGKDNNGCTSAKSVSVTVNPCTSITESNLESNKINIFPNPAYETINVAVNAGNIDLIQIIDIYGRVITENTIDATSTTINISSLSKGVYFVKVTSANKFEISKFIKE